MSKPKPWWKVWEEVKGKPIDPALKPVAEYFAEGLRVMGNLPKIPKLKGSEDDAPT